MGLNKRYLGLQNTIKSLKNNDLKGYYGKSDLLIFEDTASSEIYNLFKQGKTEKEILTILNLNTEEKTNEVY